MRLREFVAEEHNNLPDNAEPILSRLVVMPAMNPYYDYYRFMIMTAGEPDEKIPPSGTLRDVPAALVYTKEEMQMITNALKRTGHKAKFVAGAGSEEPADTNNVSPIIHNTGKRK